MRNVENIEVLRRAEAKLASSKLVSVRLWERVPGKERLYLEPKSQEAIKKAAGYCSKADLKRISGAYVDATSLSLHDLDGGDAADAVEREVQAAITAAEAELEAEAAAAADSTADSTADHEKKDAKPDVFLATELEQEEVRSEAVVDAIPEGEPLTREQIASVIEAQCVETLAFEAEANSLSNSIIAALWESDYDDSAELRKSLEFAELAEKELSSGSLAAASEAYAEAQRLLEKATLLVTYGWAPAFAGELSRWAAMAAGKAACEGVASELPEQPFYEEERKLLESGKPLCLRDGMLEALEN